MSKGYVTVPRGIWDDIAFKPEPFSPREVFIWLSQHGRIVFAHINDLCRIWRLHPRCVAAVLKRLERLGLVAVHGSGPSRSIFIRQTSPGLCGYYKTQNGGNGQFGGAKWRGGALPQKLRKQVIERDGRLCAYCGAACDVVHIDHITPVSKGGKDTVSNLTVSCAACNLSKGGKTLKEWRPRP